MVRWFLVSGGVLLLPSLALAANLTLVPVRDLSAAEESRHMIAAGKQTLQLDGSGDRVVLSYASTEPIFVELAPMVKGSSFDPVDLVFTTLPAGEDMVVTIDLTRSPSWNPWYHQYYAGFSTGSKNNDASLRDIRILPARFGTMIAATFRHLMQEEPFHVFTPHYLRGYFLLGVTLSVVLGLLTVLFMLIYRKRGARIVLLISLLSTLTYGLRWNIDLLQFSLGHLREWETRFTYAKADSAFEVAQELREEERRGRKPLGLFVCTRGTDFVTKILRYALYPLPVSLRAEDALKSTHVLVKEMDDWNYEEGMLRCGSFDGKATNVRAFPDASLLFTTSL